MKNYRRCLVLAAGVAAAALLSSCGGNVSVKGTLKDAPESEVVVKLLNLNQYEILDTLSTDDAGKFSYKMKVEKGQPEFVYLFYKDTKIASLILQKGDAVTVDADTLGIFTVEGSEESVKLQQVEQDLADFSAKFIAVTSSLEGIDQMSDEAEDLRRQLAKLYVEYYRGRLRYIMANPYSMSTIPVLYQYVSPNLPVFGQQTDAIHFSNVCDSLTTLYPDSRYVKALRQEADRRYRMLELSNKLQTAEQVSYLDIEMPDVQGVRRKLSETEGKVVLLHFWSATQPAQKMFNLDVLKPIYDEFSARGLEIYQVAIDTDKASWARTVKDQGLEWINVCDGLGTASQAVRDYNVTTLPVSFIIYDGELQGDRPTDAASLRRVLDRLLK